MYSIDNEKSAHLKERIPKESFKTCNTAEELHFLGVTRQVFPDRNI